MSVMSREMSEGGRKKKRPRDSRTESNAALMLFVRGRRAMVSVKWRRNDEIPPASLAWCSDSNVCSLTPSSAATTRMTMSVQCAPRARMALKAACPGVSRNVTHSPFGNDTNPHKRTKKKKWKRNLGITIKEASGREKQREKKIHKTSNLTDFLIFHKLAWIFFSFLKTTLTSPPSPFFSSSVKLRFH